MSEVQFIGGAPTPDDRLKDHSLYFNREISWLAFNRRVLEEALDPNWPLLERVKFLSIFHSNLDEFFMIRVSGLHEQLEASVTERSADGLSAPEQLRMIREIVHRDAGLAMQTLKDDLQPKLAEAGVRILDWEDVEPERRKELSAYFESVVFPVLTPLAFDPAHPFPFVSNLSLSLAVELTDKKEKRPAFARVKVPGLARALRAGPGRAGKDARVRPAREARRGQPRPALPGDADPRRLGVPRHARRRHRDPRGRGRRPARQRGRERPAPPFRRRHPPRGRGRGVPETVRELLRGELELEPEDVYDVDGPLGRGRPDLGPEARPAAVEGRALPALGAHDLRSAEQPLRHDPQGRRPAAPALRLVRPGAALPRGGRGGQGRPRHQDDPLPDRHGLAHRRRARAGRRERQAGRRPRRAQGPLRRGEQHPVGALARAGRRARGLRRRGPEDPRQDRPRRAPRGQHHAALRAHRHRQLQPGHGAHLHRPRPLHGAGRLRPRRLGALQLPDGLLEEDEVPQADRGAVPRSTTRCSA